MWCQHCGILVRNLPGMLTTHWAGVYLEAGAGGGGGGGHRGTPVLKIS